MTVHAQGRRMTDRWWEMDPRRMAETRGSKEPGGQLGAPCLGPTDDVRHDDKPPVHAPGCTRPRAEMQEQSPAGEGRGGGGGCGRHLGLSHLLSHAGRDGAVQQVALGVLQRVMEPRLRHSPQAVDERLRLLRLDVRVADEGFPVQGVGDGLVGRRAVPLAVHCAIPPGGMRLRWGARRAAGPTAAGFDDITFSWRTAGNSPPLVGGGPHRGRRVAHRQLLRCNRAACARPAVEQPDAIIGCAIAFHIAAADAAGCTRGADVKCWHAPRRAVTAAICYWVASPESDS